MSVPTLARTWNDGAKAIWPDARWVRGEGPYVTVQGCRGRTVMLHETVEKARLAMRRMHPHGGPCYSRHVLLALDGLLDE